MLAGEFMPLARFLDRLDVQLEDGTRRLFWHNELEEIDARGA